MLLVAKSKKPKKIPSAIHVDGTARVQTINKKQNLKFYNLINAFYKVTNVPVLLNTSFNDAGEPLVETPLDALLCFFKTQIDYLILENKIIFKPKNIKNIIKKLEIFRKKKIKKEELLLKKKLFVNFNKKEFQLRKKKEDKNAIFEALNKPSKEFIEILEKYKNKKILLAGTNDHTYALYKMHLENFKKFNFDYFEFKFNDFVKEKNNIKFVNKVKKIDDNYDLIIISSFEYMNKIQKIISEKQDSKKVFLIYNNCSRSIVDTYLIKKNKLTKNLYYYGVNQSLRI
jgi:hypothetical protein